jgi:hypothetical protein
MPTRTTQGYGAVGIIGGIAFVAILLTVVLFLVFRPSQDNGGGSDNGGGGNGGNGEQTTNAKRFNSNEILTLRELNGAYVAASNGNIATARNPSQALRIKVVKNPKNNNNAALLYRAYDSGLIADPDNGDVTYLAVDSNDDVVLRQLSENTTQGESWQLTSNAKKLFIDDGGTKKYLTIGNGNVSVVSDKSQASEIRLNRENSS